VIVDPSTALTGALRAAANLAKAITPWAETILVLPNGTPLDDKDAAIFDQVVRVPMRQIRRAWRNNVEYGPTLVTAVRHIWRLLTTDSILVLNDFYLMHGALLRLMGFQGPIITWVRADPLAFPGPLRRFWLFVTRSTSTRVVAVSDFIAHRLSELGMECVRIYDPVDPTRSRDTRSSSRSRTIVYIANYTRGKGQDDAIAAFRPIARRDPTIRLLFHGGDLGLDRNRAFLSELRVTAAASGVSDRIIFAGFVDHVADPLSQAAFALVLSHRESFSFTCLEASQNGCAVIAYRSGGPEEIIEDGQTGILCDVGDITAVTAAMEQLLGDAEYADKLGTQGAERVRTKFAPEAFAANVAKVLRDAG
jgi:glycosyltransferase involved in cell wall biosynthesis